MTHLLTSKARLALLNSLMVKVLPLQGSWPLTGVTAWPQCYTMLSGSWLITTCIKDTYSCWYPVVLKHCKLPKSLHLLHEWSHNLFVAIHNPFMVSLNLKYGTQVCVDLNYSDLISGQMQSWKRYISVTANSIFATLKITTTSIFATLWKKTRLLHVGGRWQQ